MFNIQYMAHVAGRISKSHPSGDVYEFRNADIAMEVKPKFWQPSDT